ncbi:MAG: M56 family metallopeptidase [Ferruginibacter sp.]
MEHFFYSVTITLFHSLWQSSLLLLLYIVATTVVNSISPNGKRNFLFMMLSLQFVITITTFGFLFFDISNTLLPAVTDFSNRILDLPLKTEIIYNLFVVYISIVSFKSVYLVMQWLRYRDNISKHLVKAPVEVKLFTKATALHLGIKRNVSIWYSSFVSSPLTFGFLKPVILMPISVMNGLTMAETESIIIHELTHIQKLDYLFNWFVISMETVFFFNPFVILLCKKIKLEREINCDVQVLQFDYCALKYAETLLKIARMNRSHQQFNLAAAAPDSNLLKRISYFAKEKNLNHSKPGYKIVPATIILLLITFYALIIPLKQKTNIDNLVQSSFISFESEVPVPFATATLQDAGAKTSPQTSTFKVRVNSPVNVANNSIDETNEDSNVETIAVAAGTNPVSEKVEKEMIVKEESSNGKSITIAYSIDLKNGEMMIKPIWSFSEIKGLKDSLKLKADTVLKAFNIIQ